MIRLGAALAAGVMVASSIPALADDPRQAQVEHRSENVMPFSMNATMHRFVPTRWGGVQSVFVHDADPAQVALVRAHLRKEAVAFARGDFSGPATVHGIDMPGLRALRAGAKRIRIRYATSPNGATITYTAAQPGLISALHAWFKAQVADHGAHATMKM